jgi:hypothetical protein
MIDTEDTVRSMGEMEGNSTMTNSTKKQKLPRQLPRQATTSEVAAYLQLGTPAGARVQMARWGIRSIGWAEPLAARPGERQRLPEKLWPGDEVMAMAQARPRPGRANRKPDAPPPGKAAS